ncbi:hypothetical protein F5884DRAFT_852596 [Xylogone sp. PMI_703]|nr:hypothetical protein F5884DRAFT_852596 [Xylogone sp. PMI_703]
MTVDKIGIEAVEVPNLGDEDGTEPPEPQEPVTGLEKGKKGSKNGESSHHLDICSVVGGSRSCNLLGTRAQLRWVRIRRSRSGYWIGRGPERRYIRSHIEGSALDTGTCWRNGTRWDQLGPRSSGKENRVVEKRNALEGGEANGRGGWGIGEEWRAAGDVAAKTTRKRASRAGSERVPLLTSAGDGQRPIPARPHWGKRGRGCGLGDVSRCGVSLIIVCAASMRRCFGVVF